MNSQNKVNHPTYPASFSMLDCFKKCPKNYEYKYIQKIQVNKETSEHLIIGRIVHKYLELLKEPVANSEIEKRGIEIAKKFIDSKMGQIFLGFGGLNEVKFGVNTKMEESGYNDFKNTIYRGCLDYYFINDNVAYLIDWKTGKTKSDRFLSWDQLESYTPWIFAKYPNVKKCVLSFVYVEDIVVKTKEVSREEKGIISLKILEDIFTMKSTTTFERKISDLCDWCDHKELCYSEMKQEQTNEHTIQQPNMSPEDFFNTLK